jgi:hypothetical protein
MELDVAREVLATTATTGAEGLTEPIGPVWKGRKHGRFCVLIKSTTPPGSKSHRNAGSRQDCFLVSFAAKAGHGCQAKEGQFFQCWMVFL